MLINLEEYKMLKNEIENYTSYIVLHNKLEEVKELINEAKHFYKVVEKAIEIGCINREDKRELILFIRENIADEDRSTHNVGTAFGIKEMTVEEIKKITNNIELAELYYKILNENVELTYAEKSLLDVIHDVDKEERDNFFKAINILNEVFK